MENEAKGAPLPDLSGILSKVMSNPEALSMLSSLLGGAQKPPRDEDRCEKKEACDREHDCGCDRECDRENDCRSDRECERECAVLLPEKRSKKDCVREERRRLLLALKPFLSKDRCEAIDRIILITDTLSLLQTEKRI